MNIADEIALNTMRYKFSGKTGSNTDDNYIRKEFEQEIEPQATVKAISFTPILPGALNIVFSSTLSSTLPAGVTAVIYRDEAPTPITTLDNKKTSTKIDVLPFYTYKVYITNDTSAAQNLRFAAYSTIKLNNTIAII